MIKNLNLLIKSFYDTNTIKDYIHNGKGRGTSLLAFLGFVFSVILTIQIASMIRPIFDSEVVADFAEDIYDRMPNIIIEDGELVWEDNAVETFVLGKNINLIVDTTGKIPTSEALKRGPLYLTKTALYMKSGNETKLIQLSEIQDIFDMNPFVLKEEGNKEFISELSVKGAKIFGTATIILVFLFGFLFAWLGNVILCSITKALSESFVNNFKNIEFSQRSRIAAISVTPAIFVSDMLRIFSSMNLSFLLMWTIIVVVGIVLTKEHSKEEQPEVTEEN